MTAYCAPVAATVQARTSANDPLPSSLPTQYVSASSKLPCGSPGDGGGGSGSNTSGGFSSCGCSAASSGSSLASALECRANAGLWVSATPSVGGGGGGGGGGCGPGCCSLTETGSVAQQPMGARGLAGGRPRGPTASMGWAALRPHRQPPFSFLTAVDSITSMITVCVRYLCSCHVISFKTF